MEEFGQRLELRMRTFDLLGGRVMDQIKPPDLLPAQELHKFNWTEPLEVLHLGLLPGVPGWCSVP
jgi:hypothetical protein